MINETEVCEEINISKWKKLRNQVFEKYKDEEGYYFSGTGCYRSLEKTYLSVNLIVPLSKGGQTQLDNLQLLAKWETSNKESNPSLDILEEQLKYDKNCKEDITKKQEIIHEIFIKDYNKALKKDVDNEYTFDLKYYIANSYYAKNEYEEALKYFEEALKMDSEDVCALNDIANCFYRLDRHLDAISMFEKASSLNQEEQESYQKKIDYIRKKIFRIV